MKTINIKLQLIILIVTMLLLSCNDSETEGIDGVAIQETSIELKSSYNLLDYTPNIYHNYFKETDHSAGFSSLKSNSLSEHSIVQRTNINNVSKNYSYSINGQDISSFSKATKITKTESRNIYGNKINFKIVTRNKSTKTGNSDDETEVEMYVPELVEITNPKINNTDELFPICYYKDFVLEWNADFKNKEGLVVIAEYFGNNAIPDNSTYEHILNTDVIDIDDGHAVLNNNLFKNIPNLSIVHLILLRGNVVIEEIEGEKYKFYAESHVRLPIILAKDLTTVVKE